MEENLQTINQAGPNVESTQFTQQSKSSNFLLVILSVFLVVVLCLTAFLYYQNQQLKNILANYQTQATPTPTATTDPTASWETYENIQNNYSIKYPKDGFLRLICPGEELIVTNDGVGNQISPVTMSTCSRDSRYTLETKTYDLIQTEPEKTKYYTVSKKNILLGGIPATQYIYTFTNIEEGPFPDWYTIARVNKGNKTYEIWFDEKDSLNLFNQILSTFKFTD